MSDLLRFADELYAVPLAEFTARRDARAKNLKAAGDADAAAAVKALRKPTLAAWVVDLLVRVEADQIAQVLDVGAALREAAAAMDAGELRALTRQRRQLTAALAGRARAAAAGVGVRLTDSVLDQVEATLTAAMLDAGCADAVRSGLLVTALASTGVEAADVAAAVAVPEALGFTASARAAEPPPRPELHVVPDPDADAKALAAARAEVEAAGEEVEQADEALGAAVAEFERLEARSLQLQAEIEELRRRLDALEAEADDLDEAMEGASAEVEGAQTELGEATERLAAARQALDRLS